MGHEGCLLLQEGQEIVARRYEPIESFNGRLRDEHLNVELFFSVVDAQRKILEWQRDYNEDRPHSSLGDIPPREFAAQWQSNQIAGGEILNLETV
jgi:transposase InsO family protein